MTNKTKLNPRQDLVVRYLKNKDAFLKNQKLFIKYSGTKGITVKECTDVLGTTELRKIMSEFRQSGYKVVDFWEKGEDKFGNIKSYKRYFLKGKIRK